MRNGETRIRTDAEIASLADQVFNLPTYGFGGNSALNAFNGLLSCCRDDWIREVYESRKSLHGLMSRNKDVVKIIQDVRKCLSVEVDAIGVTGSYSLGAKKCADVDIVIQGDVDTFREVRERVLWMQKRNGSVFEHGIYWPCRFFTDAGDLICCFFNYLSSRYLDVLRFGQSANSREERFSVQVADDSYAFSKTPTLLLKTHPFHKLILLSSGFKGVFRTGDLITGSGRVISWQDGEREERAIVCTDPFKKIDNWIQFFMRSHTNTLCPALES